MFKGYATATRSHSFGYYKLGEIIPIQKYPADSWYRMVKPDGSNCIVPAYCIKNIIEWDSDNMINITSYVIDDLNNGIEVDEHISNDLEVFKQGEVFMCFMNESPVLITDSINLLTEYILQYFIEKEC